MRDDMDIVATAVRIVARDAIARLLVNAAENLDRGDYPYIVDRDWEQVVQAVSELSPKAPGDIFYSVAYEVLKSRAPHE
jgi:hypothetical protein